MRTAAADDYYAWLGVGADADDDELRRAWRRLASKFHPDRAGDVATSTFQKISAAYAVLSDPVARAAYDHRRRWASATGRQDARTTSSPTGHGGPSSRRSAPGVMLSRVSGPLNSLLACGAARLDEADGAVALVLSAGEAEQGGMATISMRVAVWCPDCAACAPSRVGCRRCGGARKVEELYAAWIAVPPGVAEGEMLTPSAELPGMVKPVRFRVRFPRTA